MVNDGVRGYLNSFGFTLLAIKYLQEVDVLPIVRYDAACEHMETLREAHPLRNEANLGQLVLGFFAFWSEAFDPTAHFVSILYAGFLPKEWSLFQGHRDQKFFLLQDPLQIDRNVAKNVRLSQWTHTLSELRRSRAILRGIGHCADGQDLDVAARLRALIQDTVVLSYSDYTLQSKPLSVE